MNSNERPPLPHHDVTTEVLELFCLFSKKKNNQDSSQQN